MNLNDGLMAFVCDNIPEDWSIDINMQSGEASVILYDYEGEEVGSVHEEETVEQGIERLVNLARNSDGLGSVEFPDGATA